MIKLQLISFLFVLCVSVLCTEQQGFGNSQDVILIETPDDFAIKAPPMAKLEIHPNYHSPRIPHRPDSITLTLQMDIRRLYLLERHGSHWKGPMSVALLISDSQWDDVKGYMATMSDYLKNNMKLHIVVSKDKWKFYPINRMRNIALDGVETKWVMVLDSDEDTVFDMNTYKYEVYRAQMKLGPKIKKTVLALSSWQYTEKEGEYPMSKIELRKLYQNRAVDCKAPHYYPAYKPISFSMGQWLKNTEIMRTDYADAYEPYFIALTGSFPHFDNRFVGFGGDKSYLLLNMAAEGYQFYLLPNVFTFVPDTRHMAMTHAPQSDPEFISHMWIQFGKRYGCNACKSFSCIQNCPWIIRKSKNNAMMEPKVQSNIPIPSAKEGLNTAQIPLQPALLMKQEDIKPISTEVKQEETKQEPTQTTTTTTETKQEPTQTTEIKQEDNKQITETKQEPTIVAKQEEEKKQEFNGLSTNKK